jgi:hypothetical protein
MMVQCLGCEHVSFRKEEHDYESFRQIGPDEWEHDIKVDIYPHFIKKHNEIDSKWNIPNIVRNIYSESIIAIEEKAYTLAGLGLRATIEAICNEQEVRGANLQKRINAMVREGLISKKDSKRLHAIRFMGNDAAHEIKKAKKDSVLIALKIIEHILLTLYILDDEVNQHLETPLTSFEELIQVLEENKKNYSSTETITFVKWLSKDYRRIVENPQVFENKLIEYINEGKFEGVELVDIDGTSSQGYKISVTNLEEDIDIEDFEIDDIGL